MSLLTPGGGAEGGAGRGREEVEWGVVQEHIYSL